MTLAALLVAGGLLEDLGLAETRVRARAAAEAAATPTAPFAPRLWKHVPPADAAPPDAGPVGPLVLPPGPPEPFGRRRRRLDPRVGPAPLPTRCPLCRRLGPPCPVATVEKVSRRGHRYHERACVRPTRSPAP